jgi:prepilin-type N-terminal cleavage/methylation domain-containing protein
MTAFGAGRLLRVAAGNGGFALIEILIATLIFSIVALGLTQTIVSAQEARRTSERWMRATQLAEELMERVRAGERGGPPEVIGLFTRSWRAQAFSGNLALSRIDVTVTWSDRRPQQFVLSALVRGGR